MPFLHVDSPLQSTWTKYECHVRYFLYVSKQDQNWLKQKVTIFRKCITEEEINTLLTNEKLQTNNSPLCEFVIDHDGKIEDDVGFIQIDFANAAIGGGTLGLCDVQEEIRVTINTECIVSMLLSPETMRYNESIIIQNSQQFFDYTGYRDSFKYKKTLKEKKTSTIVAIDAKR